MPYVRPTPTRPLLLDGGMGTLLKPHMDQGDYTTLWSAAAFLTPEGEQAVVAAHVLYLQAGAQMLLTNTYGCTQEMLAKRGHEAQQRAWIGRACALAQTAVAQHARGGAASAEPVVVGGSVPPLGVSYRPDLAHDDAAMRAEYAVMVDALVAGGIDVLVCETMASVREAGVAVDVARTQGQGTPVWVAVTLADSVDAGTGEAVLRSGESMAALVAAVGDAVDVLLVNCCRPDVATTALRTLRTLTRTPLGVYANRFACVPCGWTLDSQGSTLERRTDLNPEQYAAYAREWRALGAAVVGGCCGIGPEHIAAVGPVMAHEGVHPTLNTTPDPSSHSPLHSHTTATAITQ